MEQGIFDVIFFISNILCLPEAKTLPRCIRAIPLIFFLKVRQNGKTGRRRGALYFRKNRVSRSVQIFEFKGKLLGNWEPKLTVPSAGDLAGKLR